MNKYVVYFETSDGSDVGLIFEIEVNVNRANSPTDEELILDYLNLNYGNTVNYETLKWTSLEHVVEVTKNYMIET